MSMNIEIKKLDDEILQEKAMLDILVGHLEQMQIRVNDQRKKIAKLENLRRTAGSRVP